jgi:hypothetical protein
LIAFFLLFGGEEDDDWLKSYVSNAPNLSYGLEGPKERRVSGNLERRRERNEDEEGDPGLKEAGLARGGWRMNDKSTEGGLIVFVLDTLGNHDLDLKVLGLGNCFRLNIVKAVKSEDAWGGHCSNAFELRNDGEEDDDDDDDVVTRPSPTITPPSDSSVTTWKSGAPSLLLPKDEEEEDDEEGRLLPLMYVITDSKTLPFSPSSKTRTFEFRVCLYPESPVPGDVELW